MSLNGANYGRDKLIDTGKVVYDYNDDWYYQFIEKYKDTPYYDQLLKNPYLISNSGSFTPNAWQSFLEFFGDYSSRDRFYSDLRQNANKTLMDTLDSMRQQEYNSIQNQVSQQDASGLNSDLMGVMSGSAGEAAGVADDASGAASSFPVADNVSSQTMNVAFQVANTGAQLVSHVMSFAKELQSLKAGNLANIGADMANHNSAMDLLMNETINTLGISDIADVDSLDSQVFLRTLKDISSDSSYSRSTRKVLSRYVDSLSGDTGTAKLQVAKQNLAEAYLKSRKASADIMSDNKFDKNLEDWISNLSTYFNNFVDKAQKLALKASALQSQMDIDYNSVHSDDGLSLGTLEGTNDLWAAKAQTLASEFTESINQLWKDVTSYLDDPKYKGKWWTSIAKALLPGVRAWTMSLAMPSFTFNRRAETTIDNSTNTTNKLGNTIINN